MFFFPLQIYLNYLANYVPNAWNYEQGCGNCDQNMVDLSQANVSQTVKKAHTGLDFPLSLQTPGLEYELRFPRLTQERPFENLYPVFCAQSVYASVNVAAIFKREKKQG